MNTLKRIAVVFAINITFVAILTLIPKSAYYHIWHKGEQTKEYYLNISWAPTGDGNSYLNPPEKDMVRTVGYPLLLKGLQAAFPQQWFIALLIFHCFVGAWLFHVCFELIGKKARILLLLGTFTAYIPFVMTDMLFAALFVTAIWQLKDKKRFWVALILLSAASLVRPSLAWFFVIIPAVMYFYGYKIRMALIAMPLVFLATSPSAVRNYINHGKFVHTTILDRNIGELYKETELPKYLYFINTFKINCLEPHWGVYKTNFTKYGWVVFTIPFYIINLWIWKWFIIRIWYRVVNWGDILLFAYIIGPSLFAPMLGRVRLPVEWILLI